MTDKQNCLTCRHVLSRDEERCEACADNWAPSGFQWTRWEPKEGVSIPPRILGPVIATVNGEDYRQVLNADERLNAAYPVEALPKPMHSRWRRWLRKVMP